MVHWASREDLAAGRLRFALAGHADPGLGRSRALAAVEQARRALPAAYEWSELAAPPYDMDQLLADDWPLYEVRRQEIVTEPHAPDAEAAYYYYPVPLRGDGSGWAGLAHVLGGCGDPFVASLVFMRSGYEQHESRFAQYLAGQLATLGQNRTIRNAYGEQIQLPPDTNAHAAAGAWHVFAYDNPHPVLARCYVTSPDVATASLVARSVAEYSAAEVHTELERTWAPATSQRIPMNDQMQAWSAMRDHGIAPTGGHQGWSSGTLPRELRRFPYLFTPSEGALLACLPTPDAQGCPGFPRSRRIAQRRAAKGLVQDHSGIRIGEFLDAGRSAGSASISLNAINRHLLVVGSPGSGKTTTVLSILLGAWRDFKLPFLAIEPVKTEYRELLREPGMDDVWIFTAGQERYSPLRLNPLHVPSGVAVEEQIGAVMAMFQAALPLDPPLPQLLEEAVEEAYLRREWSLDTTGEAADDVGIQPPTLRDVRNALSEIFDRRGYAGDVRSNLQAALGARLDSLVRGARGRMLDTVESIDWVEVMQRPVVIELDGLADQRDKALVGTMIIDKVRAVARTRGAQHTLRHITVLEEAHNLLAAVPPQSQQSQAVKGFCDAIAELRSLGEGFILSDQRPADLAQAAIANCGSRIVHMLAAAEHRELVLRDFDTSVLEAQAAARLDAGEALVRWIGMEEPEVLRVTPPEHRVATPSETSRLPVSSTDVEEHMAQVAMTLRRLLPRARCTRAVCTSGCEPARRRRAETFAQRSRGRDQADPDEVARRSAEAIGTVAADVYCAVLHIVEQVEAEGGKLDFGDAVSAARAVLSTATTQS